MAKGYNDFGPDEYANIKREVQNANQGEVGSQATEQKPFLKPPVEGPVDQPIRGQAGDSGLRQPDWPEFYSWDSAMNPDGPPGRGPVASTGPWGGINDKNKGETISSREPVTGNVEGAV